MTPELCTQAVEAALLAAGRALSLDELVGLFEEENPPPTRREVRETIESLRTLWEGRGLELAEVASGFRMQVRASHAHWMKRLWAERPPRYTRALLETLALIAYRQPITRGQIEDVRGVSVSSSIVRTLVEREWIRIVGHREVPGRPALYGTTKAFLDHFNLRSLEELPVLQAIRDVEDMVPDLFRSAGVPGTPAGAEAQEGSADGGPVPVGVAANDDEEPPPPSLSRLPDSGVSAPEEMSDRAAAQDASEVTMDRTGHEAQDQGSEIETAR